MIGINHLRTSQKIDGVLNSAQPDETPGKIIRAIGQEDFKTILSSGSTEQIAKLLDQVNNWNRSGPTEVQIAENQRRIEVATRLLQMPLSQELREKALKSKFDALSINYGINFGERLNLAGIAPSLLAFADSHRNDPKPEIAKLARLSTLKVEAFELLKHSNPVSKEAFQPIADQIVDLMQDYPNDSQLLNDLKRTITAVASYSPEDGQVLIRILVTHVESFKDSKDSKIVDYLDSLNDDLILIDSQFKSLFENRFVNGKAGQAELLTCLKSLASNPVGGSKLLTSVVYGLHWFEEAKHFEQAAEVYQAMVESAEGRASPEAAALAKRLGNSGLTRCQLEGKEWRFNGKLIRDLTWQQNLDVDELEGRVVVVIFWSMSDPNSLTALKKFHTKAVEFSQKRVVVMAVCVGEKFDETLLRLIQNYPSYLFVGYPEGVDCVPASEISMLKQCPVDRLPFAVVIDGQGRVNSVNVPFDELKTTVESVVLKQLEGS